MGKHSSVISVAEVSKGQYSVKATGVFGMGGWQRHCSEDQLSGSITLAWQRYGNNPRGCQIIGVMPKNIQELADKLLASRSEQKKIK